MRYGKKIFARPKKIKNPPTSVAVVKKIEDDTAGSKFRFFKKSGTIKPNIPAIIKFPIIETKSTKRGYEVWCGSDRLKKKINQDVKLEMDISTKQARQKRTFPVYLVYPVRGLEIKFDYANAGIKNVREESFFAGKHPQPSVTGKKGKSIAVKISDEEWIFPTSGVIFIWDD